MCWDAQPFTLTPSIFIHFFLFLFLLPPSLAFILNKKKEKKKECLIYGTKESPGSRWCGIMASLSSDPLLGQQVGQVKRRPQLRQRVEGRVGGGGSCGGWINCVLPTGIVGNKTRLLLRAAACLLRCYRCAETISKVQFNAYWCLVSSGP